MNQFTSPIGNWITRFIEQKQFAGYPYDSNLHLLRRFDKMFEMNFPNETTITKCVMDAWLNLKPGEHPNGLLRRVTPIRQLAKFMVDAGIDSYVLPGGFPRKQIKYIPHIYTKEELKVFFNAVDQYDYSYCDSMHLKTLKFILPSIFRLYYALGLRNSEGRLLKMEDVNLETGEIVIRESKGWLQRTVVAGDDILQVLNACNDGIVSVTSERNREYFFSRDNGNPMSSGSVGYWFNKFYNATKQYFTVIGNKPRVHDFRHTHCVNLINSWFREGKDLSALYPYLSAHLGHSHYADTDYYLFLVEEFYPDYNELMRSLDESLLPEVFHEEE